jgi:hypothetical protein
MNNSPLERVASSDLIESRISEIRERTPTLDAETRMLMHRHFLRIVKPPSEGGGE